MTATDPPAAPTGGYPLGHSDDELDRLKTQARLIDPVTLRFFAEAGVAPGMRVLDVGCGAGDTSLLLLAMVGASGEVVGVDRAAAAIAAARKRLAGHRNLRFVEGDPAELRFDRPFDAVLGRYVLMFQPEPARMLRKLAAHLRPGGLIAFHELDYRGIASAPPVPTFDRVWQWNAQTTRRYGADPSMGARLAAAFAAADLPTPRMSATALSGRGAASADLLLLARNLTRSLLPEMERLGIATPAEVALDSLFDRMLAEAVATDSVVVGHLQVCAWATV